MKDNHATLLLDAARKRGMMIATAESCTGGLVAAALTAIPGSSDVFDRGFATYSNAAKIQMLGVSPAIIEAYGAVSEQTARAMAEGALAHSQADLTLAITGIAGPGGSGHKPEGLVWFATALKSGPTHSERCLFGAIGRNTVRARSVEHALTLALSRIA